MSSDISSLVYAAEQEAKKLGQTASAAHLALASLNEQICEHSALAKRWLGISYVRLFSALKTIDKRALFRDRTLADTIASAEARSRALGHPTVEVSHVLVEIVCSSVLECFETRSFFNLLRRKRFTCAQVEELLGRAYYRAGRWYLRDD